LRLAVRASLEPRYGVFTGPFGARQPSRQLHSTYNVTDNIVLPAPGVLSAQMRPP
jgi:hypothetical protein